MGMETGMEMELENGGMKVAVEQFKLRVASAKLKTSFSRLS